MVIDPKWPHGHVTRKGYPAEILCTDLRRPGFRDYPILARVTVPDGSLSPGASGNQELSHCTEFGISSLGSDYDLQNAPAPKRKVRVKGWVNVYPESGSFCIGGKEAADRFAAHDRIACIEIDREVEEGEGL